MSRKELVTLTNMCLIEDSEGRVVVQRRDPKLYRWSGLAFPGGHIESGENFHDSVVREVLEETGLTIKHPQLVGLKHWPDKDGHRYIVFLYKAKHFSGQLQSSDEGQVFWLPKAELSQMDLAYDLLEVLKVMDDPSLSEFFYTQKDENGEWDKHFR
ncbi:NUDIX domain-containing protein [Streptococcus sp. zg-86]|uniref:NUDIX domain-containing protein n=1 Tax=Streptococcus zhangguiae TaxID=2664091 RepID=A0A6I4RID6_9STRE|nr:MULTISPECIES: 8-oxo-dGTP diphosphatase [unclassified Streptococcus]MTB64700.1 NUDIX domain-containing protein [Streptococcus sp. zg-86]MTB91010.1 NUDIX domain-containing protein [Streptococcus sp. zg-36]MWV56567.1 NUDIX domain-containing protein [Streptococcus sp. zg-70]QTH48530.1 8-oxo-dGTP diphosphatase [Streptococcus sp. zg-86]